MPAPPQPEDARAALVARAKKDGISELWVICHDWSGRAQVRNVPRERINRVLTKGVSFARATLGAETGDFLAVPDPTTYARIAHYPKAARTYSFLQDAAGRAWAGREVGHLVVENVEIEVQRSASRSPGAPISRSRSRTWPRWRATSRVASGQPRWRFTNSGTESTLDAVRLARAFTGRERLLKIEASYHGHHDSLMVSVKSDPKLMGSPDAPASVPQSEGIPAPYILTPAAYAHFDAISAVLQGGLEDVIAEYRLPFHLSTMGARGGITYRAEPVRNYRDYLQIDKSNAYLAWLYQCNRGLLMAPCKEENWMISVQHSTDDVQRYVDNIAEMARDLRA